MHCRYHRNGGHVVGASTTNPWGVGDPYFGVVADPATPDGADLAVPKVFASGTVRNATASEWTTCQAARASWLTRNVPWFEEAFAYRDTQEWVGDPREVYTNNYGNRNRIAIDPGVAVPSFDRLTRSLRYDWPSNAGQDYEIRSVVKLPAVVRELWLEVWLRFSPSFTTNGPVSGPNPDYKTLFIHTTPDGTGRFEFKHGNGSGSSIRVGEGAAGAFNDVSIGERCISEMDAPGQGKYFDGRWYRYRMHVALPGTFRFWIMPEDGENVRYADFNGTFARAGQYTGMDHIYLGANMNKGTSRVMSCWWGRVRAWNRDPGWQ